MGNCSPKLQSSGLDSCKQRDVYFRQYSPQSGQVYNLNDGMVWGLIPIFLAQHGLPLPQIVAVASIYPAVWCMGQLAIGSLGDL
jgi:hypothetical protein